MSSVPTMPPIWSIWACDSTTASMSPGLMPASAMLFCCRPVVGPNAFEVPMPVSNRISLSPVLTIGEFCSSTTLSGIEEVVGQHLPHFFVRHADEGALGRAERQRAVGDDSDFGFAERSSGASRASACRPWAPWRARCRRAWSMRQGKHQVRRQAKGESVAKVGSSCVPPHSCFLLRRPPSPTHGARINMLRPLAQAGKRKKVAEKCRVELCE